MKKIRNSVISILSIILVAFFSQYIKFDETTYTNNSNITYNENLKNNEIQYTKAYVSRIIDGDTIEVMIDSKKYKIRLIGIDCPEYTSKIEYFGKESTEYTTSILKEKYVFLEKDVSETDKYGRLLRYVWLELPESLSIDEIKQKMFNAILLNEGYANSATYPPDVKYSKEFKEIASEAREYNKGLWNKK